MKTQKILYLFIFIFSFLQITVGCKKEKQETKKEDPTVITKDSTKTVTSTTNTDSIFSRSLIKSWRLVSANEYSYDSETPVLVAQYGYNPDSVQLTFKENDSIVLKIKGSVPGTFIIQNGTYKARSKTIYTTLEDMQGLCPDSSSFSFETNRLYLRKDVSYLDSDNILRKKYYSSVLIESTF